MNKGQVCRKIRHSQDKDRLVIGVVSGLPRAADRSSDGARPTCVYKTGNWPSATGVPSEDIVRCSVDSRPIIDRWSDGHRTMYDDRSMIGRVPYGARTISHLSPEESEELTNHVLLVFHLLLPRLYTQNLFKIIRFYTNYYFCEMLSPIIQEHRYTL